MTSAVRNVLQKPGSQQGIIRVYGYNIQVVHEVCDFVLFQQHIYCNTPSGYCCAFYSRHFREQVQN